MLFATSARADFDATELERELFPTGLQDDARYPWALYCEVGDRVADLIGSPERTIDVFAGWAACFPELSAAVAHVTDPLELARLVTLGFSSGETQPLRGRMIELSGQRFRYEHQIDDDEAGSLGGALITAGLLVGQPCLIGLPRAHIVLELATTHTARVLVTLPPARQQPGLTSPAQPRLSSASKLLVGIRSQADRHRTAAQNLHSLALSLIPSPTLAITPLADRWLAVLADALDARFLLLWCDVGPTSRLVASRGQRDGESRVLSLSIGPRTVGALELPAATDPFPIEPLLPLLALALARRVDAPSPWGLSPAEARVCELLAQGHENTVIAKRLGLSVDTVAEQVGRVLTKSGAARRGEVVARWRAHAFGGES